MFIKLKKCFNERFPESIMERRYVDVKITRLLEGGWTDVDKYGTKTFRTGWKYRIPKGMVEVSSKWYIERFKCRKIYGIKWTRKRVAVNIYCHEIDQHVFLGYPLPERVVSVWKQAGLTI